VKLVIICTKNIKKLVYSLSKSIYFYNCDCSKYDKDKNIFIVELLICYQDSVMGFALKYNTNGRFIIKIKRLFIRDCSLMLRAFILFPFFTLCFYHAGYAFSLYLSLFLLYHAFTSK